MRPFKWRKVKFFPFIEYSRKWKKYGKAPDQTKLALTFRLRNNNA